MYVLGPQPQKTSTNAGYGSDSQQPDITTTELHLHEEYYQCHISVTPTEAMEMEQMTRKQSESQLWYQRHRPSSHCFLLWPSGKAKGYNTSWQLGEEPSEAQTNGCCVTVLGDDTQGRCSPRLHSTHGTQGQTVSVQGCGLVVDVENPCLACSPNGRVKSEANLRHHGCNLQLYRTFLTEVLVV